MKVKIKVIKEIDIKYVEVILPVRFNEEDMLNDFPMRKGDTWQATINIDSGKILNWEQGKEGSFYMKVCDEGCYELFDEDFNSIARIHDYVPNALIPGDYGDYVNFKIDKEGRIINWPKNPSVSQFFPED